MSVQEGTQQLSKAREYQVRRVKGLIIVDKCLCVHAYVCMCAVCIDSIWVPIWTLSKSQLLT